MTIKAFTTALLSIFGLSSCNFSSDNSTDVKAKPTFVVHKEIFSLYRKTDSIVYIARALTIAPDTFELNLYTINISTPEAAKQTFVSTKHLRKQEASNLKTDLEAQYNWIPAKGNDVLFIQIQPTGFKDEMQMLNKRQEIEDKLSEILENKNLGQWFASDLGPGGANILYSVTDIDESLQTVLGVLHDNNLEKQVVIGRRVLVSEGDWFYEVIYPIKYSGQFNTM